MELHGSNHPSIQTSAIISKILYKLINILGEMQLKYVMKYNIIYKRIRQHIDKETENMS